MGLSSVLVEQGFNTLSSYISSKLHEKVTREEIMARLKMALSRLEFVLERTRKLPITHVSLLHRRNMLKKAYMEGTCLLNKHRLLLQDGNGEVDQATAAAVSYLQRIITSAAANLSISSILGLGKESLCLSVARTFEWHADCADKFAADVESGCPFRRGIFPYPFVRQLFEGKILRYEKIKGSQQLCFYIWPVILEGRGLEAYLYCDYLDTEKLYSSFQLRLMLRLSESTDIVGIAIDCLRSSTPLLDLMAEDALGELAMLHDLHDVSSSFAPPWAGIRRCYIEFTEEYRSDPLCCQANGHEPSVSSTSTISSGLSLSQIFPEQAIAFGFHCYIPIVQELDRRRRRRLPQPLELTFLFAPHYCSPGTKLDERCVFEVMGNQDDRAHGDIQQMVGMVRSEAIDCLVRQPDLTNCAAYWISNHGYAGFDVKRPSADVAVAVARTSSRCETRSAGKRKR